MASRTRHNDRTTPTQEPAAHCGVRGAERQAGDRLEPPTHLALAGRGPHPPFADYPWGTQDPFGRLSQVGRAAMEQATTLRLPSGTPPPPFGSWDPASRALALHPLARGGVERQHRQRLLRRLADDVRLGRTGRECGPTLADGTDAGSGDRVPAFRLLRLLDRGAMAEYLAALSRVSIRVTDRV